MSPSAKHSSETSPRKTTVSAAIANLDKQLGLQRKGRPQMIGPPIHIGASTVLREENRCDGPGEASACCRQSQISTGHRRGVQTLLINLHGSEIASLDDRD